MLDHTIKKDAERRCEKCPEPVRIGDNGLIRKQWPKQLRLEPGGLPVNPLEYGGIEAKLIAKIAKDQGFVVACASPL
jgi:hypothetical protein